MHVTMYSISPKCFSYRLHFSICEVTTFGYFTKLFNIHTSVLVDLDKMVEFSFAM